MRKWTADVLRMMASALDPGPKKEGAAVATQPVPPQAAPGAAGQRTVPVSAMQVRVTSPSRLPGFATMVSGRRGGQVGRVQAGVWSAAGMQSPATTTAVGPLPRIEFPRPSEGGAETASGSETTSARGHAASVPPGRGGPAAFHPWPADPPKVRHP